MYLNNQTLIVLVNQKADGLMSKDIQAESEVILFLLYPKNV